MIGFKSRGSFQNTEKFLKRMQTKDFYKNLDKFGQRGVDALSSATPVDSGVTAASWGYNIVHKRDQVTIEWYNTHINKGSVIALLIQYGHGTGTGGYVSGLDYINPVIKPLFEKIADDVWKEVTR